MQRKVLELEMLYKFVKQLFQLSDIEHPRQKILFSVEKQTSLGMLSGKRDIME